MSPIEILWIILTGLFALVGMARGYPRELGVTTIVLVGLLILERFGPPIIEFFDGQVAPAMGFRILQQPNSDAIQCIVYTSIFLSIVFASYAGETLTFPGRPARGRIGSVLNLANGLVNGYLINGTVWHYLDKYNYPLQQWGLFQPPLSRLAQEIVKYLPPRVLDTTMLTVLVALLLLLRVRR